MKYRRLVIFPTCLSLLLLSSLNANATGVIDQLLEIYSNQGAGSFSAKHGRTAWSQTHHVKGQQRACSSCHSNELTKAGRHKITGKIIKPMASSVNSERLTDRKKIEKWFKRNCKWTLGRECTAQEKGNYLLYLKQF